MSNLIYEPSKGLMFVSAVNELKGVLQRENQAYRIMKFNDILVTVSVDSNTDDLCTIYNLKHKIRQLEK
jgi:hypothetical protein